MIAVDTSIAIAAFGDWHELNVEACALLDQGVAIPAHALLETYSVLTAFPPPHRAPPSIVEAWLEDRFHSILPPPDGDAHRELLRRLTAADRTGGAVYDALVGLTAKLAGLTLVTADLRALPIYQLLGVEVAPLRDSRR